MRAETMTLDIARLHYDDGDFFAKVRALRNPQTSAQTAAAAKVADIISRVRGGGYAALCDISAKLDGAVNDDEVCITLDDKARADIMAKADVKLLAALQTAAERLREYHRRQLPKEWQKERHKERAKEHPQECYQQWQFADDDGNILGERASPVERAMIYAPGGKAAYPSSVLMGVIPAKVAGVNDVCVSTPARGGEVNNAVLLAAAVAGADSVWKFGGAQAVAAFAFGCAPVPRADIIAGPGNVYVSEAKRQLFGEVGLDSIAGPSEVMIIFDKGANPQWVAADLIAQAEHDEDAVCIGICDCDVDAVYDALAAQLKTTPRKAIAARALTKGGALITARDICQCCEIANAFAPEHLQVMCQDADAIAEKITTAGAVFVGAQTPVAFGDYCAGTNHVLPTGGSARFFSPLSARHFIRRTSFFRASPKGAAKLSKTTATIADAEGFYAHSHSALLRGDDNNNNKR
ncbi:MAG: histidinol dehydrogenase [Gammaproteobacteria bacterium]